ncbi:MAG TPA: hypothetical protein VHV75_14150, partial [Solirubrobacteraceae bacterium]|nr:hypothetical protein [Solirubrobacteraceae bacterium]
MSHPPKLRVLAIWLAAAAISAATPAIAAASSPVQLPHASSTKIIPNLGAGGLRLGQKLFPLPQGWRHPNKCENLRGFGV